MASSRRAQMVDLDLEKFFDRVNHDRLMSRIMQRENDKALLKLIRAASSGVPAEGRGLPRSTGEPPRDT